MLVCPVVYVCLKEKEVIDILCFVFADRWDAEEAVSCHSICGRVQCGDPGRADSGSGSICQEGNLGTAAQI